MCTVVLLARPGDDWPLLLAANRDERVDRPWKPPAAHWPDDPEVVAGIDESGNGTWMGVNGAGVVAAVLNRPGSLGPQQGKRSRGILPLIALRQHTAREAASAIVAEDAGQFRAFNMVFADRTGAIFLRGSGSGHPEAEPLRPGVHMVTSHDPDDPGSPRTARHLPRFRAAVPSGPTGLCWDARDWEPWRTILADSGGPPESSINVSPRSGFGTVCSSLLAVPATGMAQWLFAAGPPDQAAFRRVAL